MVVVCGNRCLLRGSGGPRCGFTIREYNVSNRYNGSMELVLTKRQEM